LSPGQQTLCVDGLTSHGVAVHGCGSLYVTGGLDHDSRGQLGRKPGLKPGPRGLIQVVLPQPTFVRIDVLDLQGRVVAVIQQGMLPAGSTQRAWNVGAVRPGVYLARMRGDGVSATAKVVVTP